MTKTAITGNGVKTAFERVKKMYGKENAEENCRLVPTPKAHRWCEDIVWSAINEETKKLNW